MTASWKKTTALLISAPIGLAITAGVLWLFNLQPSSIDHWQSFPSGWRIYDLITNGVAVLMFFGTTRAAYRVLQEVWIKEIKTSPYDDPQ